MENIYGYKLPHGTLILYGHNLKVCKNYIDDVINSVEDVCKYCSNHNIHIIHKYTHNIIGFTEFIRVYRLTKKYNVRGSWDEIQQYIDNKD